MGKLTQLFSDYVNAVRVSRAGRRSLPSAVHSVLMARLAYNIGPRYHSLYALSEQPRRDWGSYILEDDFRPVLKRVNDDKGRVLLRDKLAFFRHCQRHGIATIPVLATIERNRDGTDDLMASDADAFSAKVAGAGTDLFFKLIDGSWGTGAFVADFAGADTWRVEDRAMDAAGLFQLCMGRETDSRGWLVQPRLQNHARLAGIMSPSALGTARIVTVRRDGIHAACGVIRLPVGSNVADNFAHGTSGNLTASIDMNAGRVGMARASRSNDWPEIVDVPSHPETGLKIEGFELPFWREALALVSHAHESLDTTRAVGWDVAFTDDGPILVEGNGLFDVDLIQVAMNRGISPLLMPYFDSVI